MPASMRPPGGPARAGATATLVDTVDLPTPPLPDEIARTLPRCGRSTGVGGGGTPAGPARGAGCAGGARPAPPPGAVTRPPRPPRTPRPPLRTPPGGGPGSPPPRREGDGA